MDTNLAILVDRTCITLTLRPGDILRCRQGALWLTAEARGHRVDDVVLTPGECYRVTARGRYFVSAPGGEPALCAIDASLRIQSATRRTSSRGWSLAWISQ